MFYYDWLGFALLYLFRLCFVLKMMKYFRCLLLLLLQPKESLLVLLTMKPLSYHTSYGSSCYGIASLLPHNKEENWLFCQFTAVIDRAALVLFYVSGAKLQLQVSGGGGGSGARS